MKYPSKILSHASLTVASAFAVVRTTVASVAVTRSRELKLAKGNTYRSNAK
jgi:hypothetical protein